MAMEARIKDFLFNIITFLATAAFVGAMIIWEGLKKLPFYLSLALAALLFMFASYKIFSWLIWFCTNWW